MVEARTLDLDVHLERRHTVVVAGHLEVHVSQGVLAPEDVSKDDKRPIWLENQAHRNASDHPVDRHARVEHRQAAA